MGDNGVWEKVWGENVDVKLLFLDLSKKFRVKASLDHQLSTATQKRKETDDHIMSALDSLVTCSSQVGHMTTNVEFTVYRHKHS